MLAQICLTASLFVISAAAKVYKPPISGKYFYVNFLLDSSKGLHEVNLRDVNSGNDMWMMLTADTGNVGLFS